MDEPESFPVTFHKLVVSAECAMEAQRIEKLKNNKSWNDFLISTNFNERIT